MFIIIIIISYYVKDNSCTSCSFNSPTFPYGLVGEKTEKKKKIPSQRPIRHALLQVSPLQGSGKKKEFAHTELSVR